MNLRKHKAALRRSAHEVTATAWQDYRTFSGYWRQHVILRLGVCFAVLFVLFFVCGVIRLDPDFGWHLRTGFYIREHGVPMHDIYTFTARSWRWVNHEWGNDVILSYIYGWGGYAWATAFYAALWAGAFVIAAGRKARLLTMVVAGLAVTPYAVLRPLGWSVLLFALSLSIVRSRQTKRYWYLPFIFLVWANLHAGFIAGLAMIGYFTIRWRSKRLALILVLCAAATLLNPYGLRLYEEIIRTLTDSQLHTQINEWAYLHIPLQARLYLALWLSGFGLFAWHQWRNWLGLSQFLLASALSATRNMPLFVIASLSELDEYVTKAVASIRGKLRRSQKIVLIMLAIILFGCFSYTLGSVYLPYHTDRESSYPVQAITYLRAEPCQGNLFNSYNYGGYLIWKLPDQKVYIDGRMPTWKPYMDRYEAILKDPAHNYQAEFQRYHITCALLEETPVTAKLVAVLKKADWQTVMSVNDALLMLAPGGTK